MLKFSKANNKIKALAKVKSLKSYLAGGRKIYSFDLLSGWSCPFANECLSKVRVSKQGKRTVHDGPNTKFRCFSASQEALLSGVYNLRKGNYDALRNLTGQDMAWQLHHSLPKNAGIIRIHAAGDFFNEDYFKAWIYVATLNPSVLFYAYTKSLPYWIKYRDKIPGNFVLTASYGGRMDRLILQEKLPYSKVVLSEKEAKDQKLSIDHDDSHAADPTVHAFALLIHGTQPKGSEAGKAVRKLKGKGSYGN